MKEQNIQIPFLRQSLAYRRFKDQQTLCSDFYWYNILTRTMACKYSINYKEDDNPNLALENNNIHFPDTFDKWKKNIKNTENWLRLNVLLVSNSYFEQYFFEIVNILLSSRPSLLLGDHETINGVHFLKLGIYLVNFLNYNNTFDKEFQYLNHTLKANILEFHI